MPVESFKNVEISSKCICYLWKFSSIFTCMIYNGKAFYSISIHENALNQIIVNVDTNHLLPLDWGIVVIYSFEFGKPIIGLAKKNHQKS